MVGGHSLLHPRDAGGVGMMHRSKLYSPGDLLTGRGWTKELIADVLGDPDIVLTYPRDKDRPPESFFLRTRVFGMERKKQVQAVTVARLLELGERRRAKEAQIMRDAADAAEIVVETMSIHDLKIRALETWYEELARARKSAPSTMDERRLTKTERLAMAAIVSQSCPWSPEHHHEIAAGGKVMIAARQAFATRP